MYVMHPVICFLGILIYHVLIHFCFAYTLIVLISELNVQNMRFVAHTCIQYVEQMAVFLLGGNSLSKRPEK